MFLLCIYIIFARTIQKGSHRNKVGVNRRNVAVCSKKHKEESEN